MIPVTPHGTVTAAGELVVGLDTGDGAAVVRISDGVAVIATTDFSRHSLD